MRDASEEEKEWLGRSASERGLLVLRRMSIDLDGDVFQGGDGIDVTGLVKGDETVRLVTKGGGLPDFSGSGASGLLDETLGHVAKQGTKALFAQG